MFPIVRAQKEDGKNGLICLVSMFYTLTTIKNIWSLCNSPEE